MSIRKKNLSKQGLAGIARQNNEVFEEIILSIPVNVYWKNLKGEFLGCNKAVAAICHLDDPKEIIGKTNYDLFDKVMADKITKNDKIVFEKEKVLVIEETGVNETREIVTYLTTKSPLYNKKGELVGLLGVSQNINDRKRAEEYRIKNEAAQKMIKFSSLIAGSIAHELRNPLAGIRMQMSLLKILSEQKKQPHTLAIKSKTSLKIAEDVTNIVDSTSYIIDSMLKKVRAFATGGVTHRKLKELSIVSDVKRFLKKYPFIKDEKKLVKTIFNVPFTYIGDQVLTAHVLGNLMKNALHAIKETDKADAAITIETKTMGDCNFLIFRDTATGIPALLLSKIFEQFVTRKAKHGGTGLGLAFCKSVMRDTYNGDITCNSVKGAYTEFVLKFPKPKNIS